MKMIEFLDKDRERVMLSLRGVLTPADARQILEKEADRLLLQYNEECTSVRVRDAASGMVQALRSSVPMLDAMGEPRVWSLEGGGRDGSEGRKSRGRSLSRILLGVGAVLTIAAFAVPALSVGGSAAAGALLKGILLPVAGGSCMYLAGRTAGKEARIGFPKSGQTSGSPDAAPAQRIEITIDPEKLWNSLRGAVMVIDRNLESTLESENYDRRRELAAAAGANGITAGEIELFSGLLETADADSPQMAADIRYYLHKKEVDVLSWTPENSAWFEILPALPGAIPAGKAGKTGQDRGRTGPEEDSAVTIRPALAQKGKLLRKGTAVRQ